MIDYGPILAPDETYHIYNRANGNEKIFLSSENYRFFLEKFKLYIQPIADTYCYCLLPNHFHFLIRIKSADEIQKIFPDFDNSESSRLILSKQFSNLFSSYTQAFNKQQNRKGSLFMKNFKRKKITDIKYLRKVVHYIHFNPVEAGLSKKPIDWKHSSYKSIISTAPTLLLRDELFYLFNDKENFEYVHLTAANSTEKDAVSFL